MHSVSARKSYSINFFWRRENRALKFWGFDELLFVHRLKFVFAVILNLPLVGKGWKYDILWLATTTFKRIVYNLFKCMRFVICMSNYWNMRSFKAFVYNWLEKNFSRDILLKAQNCFWDRKSLFLTTRPNLPCGAVFFPFSKAKKKCACCSGYLPGRTNKNLLMLLCFAFQMVDIHLFR